jgi:hypothetical protein
MRLRRRFLTGLLGVATIVLPGCTNLGKVDQGRVIRFDLATGMVTIIRDSNYADPSHPRYDVLPPVTVRIPEDRKQMGPAPEPGGLLHLDLQAKTAIIFDRSKQRIATVPFRVLETDDRVPVNDSRVTGGLLPLMHRDQKAVTLYSPDTRQIVKISIPDEFLSLPVEAWRAGDEIRYYYKDPAQALRMMNVTKTRIS